MNASSVDDRAAQHLREIYEGMLLPAPPETLDETACGSTPKMIAHLAVAAATSGSSESDWRWWMYQRFPILASGQIDEAASCMHSSGLWPWPRPWPADPD